MHLNISLSSCRCVFDLTNELSFALRPIPAFHNTNDYFQRPRDMYGVPYYSILTFVLASVELLLSLNMLRLASMIERGIA